MQLPVSIHQRMAVAAKTSEHKTPMLQHLAVGQPLELEALVWAVVESREHLGLPMTHTRTVYSCAKLLAQHRDLASR